MALDEINPTVLCNLGINSPNQARNLALNMRNSIPDLASSSSLAAATAIKTA